MHGQAKLLREGYRTRDGHVIEGFGRLVHPGRSVAVVNRPDPLIRRPAPRRRSPAAGTHTVSTTVLRLPDPRSRRRWWADSAGLYPGLPSGQQTTPAIVWNPFTALAPAERSPFSADRVTVLDLLDDWSTHHAFAPIRDDVKRAYARAFAAATHVTANAEGTVALARRFGRDDVVLLPNGCDPDRFDARSRATGPTRVGYVGKIGQRLDLAGILATVRSLPAVEFVFAGPVLDRGYRRPLAGCPNVRLLGDVHYDDVPRLLTTFDVGWVPHRVGDGEVGGDIIKTYEYRAAGLPTLSTPVAGAGSRGVGGVTVLPIGSHAGCLAAWADGVRVARVPGSIPAEATWEHKARFLLGVLGVAACGS